MKSLKQTLMDRDGIDETEADQLIKECRDDLYERLGSGESFTECYDICEEYFGLEPDYLMELI